MLTSLVGYTGFVMLIAAILFLTTISVTKFKENYTVLVVIILLFASLFFLMVDVDEFTEKQHETITNLEIRLQECGGKLEKCIEKKQEKEETE